MPDKKNTHQEHTPAELFQKSVYDNPLPSFQQFWDKNKAVIAPRPRRAFFSSFVLRPLPVLSAIAAVLVIGVLTAVFTINIISAPAFYITRSTGLPAVNGPAGSLDSNAWKNGIRKGSTITTGSNDRVELSLPGALAAVMEPGSSVVLENISSSGRLDTRLRLNFGSVHISVAPLSNRGLVAVVADNMEISVKGTVFSVKSVPAGGSSIAVLAGAVDIKPLIASAAENGFKSFMQERGGHITLSENEVLDSRYDSTVTQSSRVYHVRKPTPDEISALKYVQTLPVNSTKTDWRVIRLVTQPAGAAALINGRPAGITPCFLSLDIYSNSSLSLEYPGYISLITNIPAGRQPAAMALELITNTNAASDAPRLVRSVAMALPVNADNSAFSLDTLVFTVENRVYVISRKTGAVSQGSADSGIKLTAPVISKGLIFAGSESGGLYCFNMKAVSVWKDSRPGAMLYGTRPAVSDGIIAAPSVDRGIYIFNSGGTLMDHLEIPDAVYSTPVITPDGSILYYAVEYGTVRAYSLVDKKELWRAELSSGRLMKPLALYNGVLAVPLNRNGLAVTGLDKRSGSVLWETPLPAGVKDINMQMGSGLLGFKSGGTAWTMNIQSGRLNRITLFNENILHMAAGSGGTTVLGLSGGLLLSSYGRESRLEFPGAIQVYKQENSLIVIYSGRFDILELPPAAR